MADLRKELYRIRGRISDTSFLANNEIFGDVLAKI